MHRIPPVGATILCGLTAFGLSTLLTLACGPGPEPDASAAPAPEAPALSVAVADCGLDVALLPGGVPEPPQAQPVAPYHVPVLFTPADANGVRDTVELGVVVDASALDPAGLRADLFIVRTVDCRVVRRLETAPAADDPPRVAVVWDGQDDTGELVPPGRYLVATSLSDARGRELPLPPAHHVVVGAEDDPCDLPDTPRTELADEVFLVPEGSGPREFELDLGDDVGGHLCVEMRSLPGLQRPDVESVALNGRELVAPGDFDGADEVGVSYLKNDGSGLFKIAITSGAMGVVIWQPPIGPPPPIEREDIDCTGRLMGYRHPLRADLPRPEIHRGGVAVRCVALFKGIEVNTTILTVNSDGVAVEYGFAVEQWTRSVMASGSTGADGSFALTVTAEDQEQRLGGSDRLHAVWAMCADWSQCGSESIPARAQDATNPVDLEIGDVVNLAAAGFTARLVTDGPPYGPGEENDLPIAVHEAFDPLRENGSHYSVWLLAGQPTDRTRHGGSSDDPDDLVAPQDICEERTRGPCIPFTDACSPQVCSASPGGAVVCGGLDLLGPILAGGYDVWLIDNLVPDRTVVPTAAAAPEVYQRLLDAPAPDPDRRLAVVGLSAGSVVARTALAMWEAKDAIVQGAVPGLSFQNPDAFDASPSRVALYVSFDGPHLGARVPVSFQYYIKDPDLPRRRIPNLLNSNSARELLLQFVEPVVNNACFQPDGEPPKSCTIPGNIGLSAGTVSSDAAGDLINTTIDRLGAALPQPDPDTGLPAGIPSIAIANGSLTRTPNHGGEDRMLVARIDLGEKVVTHTVKAAIPQGRGSGFSSMCTAGELAGPSGQLVQEWQQIALMLRCDWVKDNIPVPIVDNLLGLAGMPGLAAVVCGFGSGVVALDTGQGWDSPYLDAIDAPVSLEVPIRYTTFIPTRSALLINEALPEERLTPEHVPDRWLDALWFEANESHTEVNEDHCQFVSFYLDGFMKGDRDGFPACGDVTATCAAGGRRLGLKRDPDQRLDGEPGRFCEADDGNPALTPPGFFTPLLDTDP